MNICTVKECPNALVLYLKREVMKNLKAISEVVRKQLLIIASLLIGTGASFAQGWEYNYGNPSTVYDRLYSGVEVSDGYVGAGYTTSPSGSYIIKVDDNGAMIWERKYGNYTTINSIRKTDDGGFILAGTHSNGSNDTDIKLIKTDADGYQLWERTFTGAFMNSGHYAEQTSDGGYVLSCTRNRDLHDQYDTGDICLIKTDATGSAVWDENYGGTGYDAAASVTSTNDGGYAIVGTTINSVYANGTFVIKTNATGDTLWTRVFGQNYDSGISIKEDNLGNLVLLNSNSFGPTIQLIKLSSVGDSL